MTEQTEGQIDQQTKEPGRWVLVLNPAAGRGRAGRVLLQLRQLLETRQIDADVFLTRREGDAENWVRNLSLAPGSVVVAVGGDGTVHEVGAALIDRPEVAMGVVPVGSGNDYAALMNMPLDPAEALGEVLDGENMRWDVGLVGELPFLNTVGFGLSASVSMHSRQTGPLRGLPRYTLAAFRSFLRHRHLLLGVDGLQASGTHRLTLMEVGIGNRCGGGFYLTKNADPTDGLLDVCLVEAMPVARMPFLLPRGLKGKHLDHPLVKYEQVPSFRIRVEANTVVHMDGEIRTLPRGEHSIRVKPRALTVRLPKGRAAELLAKGAASS